MEIITGLLVGSLCGVILGLVPGFNIGIAFLGAASLPEPRFAIGLIIGIDVTSSSIKQLSLLNSRNREDLDDSITKYENKEKLCIASIFSYTFIKIMLSIAVAFILLMAGKNIVNLGEEGKLLSLFLGISTWLAILLKSKHWKLALIAAIGFSLLAIFTVEISTIKQPMFIIVSGIFSANLINQARYQPEKIVLTNTSNPGALRLEGIASGFLSGFLWGLPTNAVCSLLKDEKGECPLDTVSRSAIADATVSVIGLALLMSLNSAKSAAASSAQSLQIEFHPNEISGVLIVSAITTAIIYQLWNPIMHIYTGIHNNTPLIVNRVNVIATVGILVIMSNGWFLVISLMALMLNKLIKIAEAPKELSLICLAILPIISIIKSLI